MTHRPHTAGVRACAFLTTALCTTAVWAEDIGSCFLEEVQDAVECGATTVTSAAECGFTTVASAAQCGVEQVTNAALCGTRTVVSAAQCGVSTVTSVAQCGSRTVTSAAQCGVRTVTSAAQCGTQSIVSAAQCGVDQISSFFGIFRKPRSCSVPKSCTVARSCNVPLTCSVPKTCRVANTCSRPKTCEVAGTCEIANRCDVQVCRQDRPFGPCVPGVIPCDVPGFTCSPVVDKDVFQCVPSYDRNLDIASNAVCNSLYSAAVAERAFSSGQTLSFGNGSSLAAGVASSAEVGTVYGPDGEYGCYRAVCAGGLSDLSIAAYVGFGLYTSWEDFAGASRVLTAGASAPVVEVGYTTAAVLSTSGDLIGSTHAASFGVGVLPAQAGVLSCNTVVAEPR